VRLVFALGGSGGVHVCGGCPENVDQIPYASRTDRLPLARISYHGSVFRTVIVACVLLFLVLVLAALWSGFHWPPPRLILKYGFPPAGGPTGRTMTIEGVEFVELKPGYFRMGSHYFCKDGDLLGSICAPLGVPWGRWPWHAPMHDPPHWEEVGRPFWLARLETTNSQFERFDPGHHRDWPADDDPVTSVTLAAAREFCAWLSGRSRRTVCLPTEMEWEFACRAGSSEEFCYGGNEDDLGEYGWSLENSAGRANRVGSLKPNVWGLFDMHGNVAEWCEDSGAANDAPIRRAYAPERERVARRGVARGGSWDMFAGNCRSSMRMQTPETLMKNYLGFRTACVDPSVHSGE
jgi:formylglycine-generating enzyme required for sulfatase activity